MHALPHPRPQSIERSAEIITFAELQRTRSLRAMAWDSGPPGEAHPWAYAFPRPSQTLSSRR